METIEIQAARPYRVGIGRDILKDAAKYIRWEHPEGKVMIITDDDVDYYYGNLVQEGFEAEGYEVYRFVFPSGEQSKVLPMADEIYSALSEKEFDRTDLIAALGGGVAGDLAGFVASTYMRGIDYVQLPTSLLAMVDSSIGGKTAVDTQAGKNTVGTFYQPLMVLCDLDCLETLPDDQYFSGLAEMIKYGVIAGEELFEKFEHEDFDKDMEELVRMCINVKKSYVEQDPYDEHIRKLLNLGHTMGHAIETASGYSITHGQAVAMGMIGMAEIHETQCAERIRNVFENLGYEGLDIDYEAEELASYMAADKKRNGDFIVTVVPLGIGSCSLEQLPVDDIQDTIAKVCIG